MSAEELGALQRAHWGATAGAWRELAEQVERHAAPVSGRMLAAAAPGPGERVLELACGTGDLGLAAAERVGDGGEVVLIDGAAEMVELARERAAAAGAANVEAHEEDLLALSLPDASVDVVLCRNGLMLVPDPAAAAREMLRVLRSGGRAVVAVWGARERNPWLAILLDAVGAQFGAPVPPPGMPGPFALGEPERLAELLARAGWEDVAVDEVPAPLRVGSAAEWWESVPRLAGPLAQALDALPGDVVAAIRARTEEPLAARAATGGLELPGLALVAAGTRRAG